MKIAIGCDPNAQDAKVELIKFIESKKLGEVTDFGSEDPIYANVAIEVAEAVAAGKYDRGILICGTGLGVSIAANKVKGAYAALLSDIYSAKRARLSNDANIACMGAFTTGNKLREELTEAFLTNEFVSGCSSQPKVDAFRAYESK
ncbi:MAG: RpiB/LacA/LacB family sugar-phosphate isomerase [Lachnospiraceae bacterium]|nr:RpiB/LacA/LacB family sugar-phosphate isomerase [Lachnospiraceae bacterium]